MFNALKRLTRKFIGSPGGSIVVNMEGIPVNKFTDYASYLEACSKKVWASWKAVDVVAQVVSDTESTVVNAAGMPVKSPDLQRLIAYPNAQESGAEFLYKTVFHLKLTGNAYWFKSESNLKGDKPRELILLNPKRVRIIPDKVARIAGYEYEVNGQRIPLDVSEVIHLKRPHPDNDMFGLGDVEASEDVFNEHLNRNKWGEKFWKNGAAPSGLLVCEESPNDKAEWELLKKQWQKEYGGVENSGKTAWLSGKWSYHQLGLSAVELQDIEKLKLNVEQIFAVHGVPLSVAGVRDAANFATARIDDIRFRRYTVKPLVRTIEAAINRGLAPGYGAVNVRFNVVGLSNTGEIIADFAPLFDRGGISINELRERAGLVRLDEPLFDQYFINAGLVPLDLAGVADMGATNQTAKNIVERFVRDGLRSGIRDGDAKP